MSLTTIIFSKNRPAQLDLLLRSMKQNAPAFMQDLRVIFAATSEEFWRGYETCHTEHPLRFAVESPESPDASFQLRVALELRKTGDKVAFFVDDDVIYRPLPVSSPAAWLDLFPETLCFSLRLGANTTECYSMRQTQGIPFAKAVGSFLHWNWRDATARFDWAYPASLDGGIFRRDDLLRMLEGEPFTNPNELEEVLVHGCRSTVYPIEMASFKESVLVGIPANSVSDTHGSNRHGDTVAWSPERLNDDYLQGLRLSLRIIENSAALVNAAHVELPLVWEAQ